MATKYVGADVRRVEDPRLITGAGRYVGDLQLPGMLHLALKRNPHPKARIVRIDVAKARTAPGVVLVWTGEDLKQLPPMPTNRGLPNIKVPNIPVLETGIAHVVGMPVAAVVAESRQQAEDGADLIEVEYEILPAVANAEEALKEGAPLVHQALGTNVSFRIVRKTGDPDAAFAAAHRVASIRLFQPRVAAVALESRGVLASYDPHDDYLTVWISTQTPHRPSASLPDFVGLPESRIRTIAPDVGGGFGSKSPLSREDVLCALASKQLHRPVRWLGDRIEDIQTTQQGRDTLAYADAALDGDCRITAIRMRIISNLGAYLNPATPGPALVRLRRMATGAYQVPNLGFEALGVLTDTISTGPYRGAGRPDVVIIVERLMDEVAHVCGLDPVEARRRNFIRADQMPYKTAAGSTYDSGDYEENLDLGLRVADYEGLRRRQAEARASGELLGIGIATFVEPSGGAMHESGLVRIDQTGSVIAFTGSSPHGQGHETAFAQVLADRLGMPFESVSIRHGGPASGRPSGIGTFGSRSLLTGGSALVAAADRVVEKARRIAAHLLEASTDDVELRDGRFMVAGAPDLPQVGWREITSPAYGRGGSLPPDEEMGLEATVHFKPKDACWGYGTYIAAVSIDRESGCVMLQKLIAVDDCGNVVNPLLVEGQLHGGIAQGIGQAFLEQFAFDETGQPLSGTLMDYLLPGFDSMPELVFDRTVTPTPLNPLGVKGVGEAGTIGAPAAILNAVVDALRPLGVKDVDFPFAPHRIWEILQANGRK